ncbi:MAG TPA: response regulator transcription factor [Chloroflexota bacterium]|nr:response regulator transcription factor [Chloroflexota bacterium]
MKLLVIDDDPAVCDALRVSFTFQRHDCRVGAAEDGRAGLQAFFEQQPDVVVLDIGLPKMNGLEVLARIREAAHTPVIILSARDGELDIVRALEMGADDYVTKPFSCLELMARIRAQARRVDAGARISTDPETFSADGLTIHFPSQEVRVNGVRVPLTNTEYRLLYHLVRNAGRVMPHRTLLQLAWGSESYGTDVVRVYVSRLRSKLEPNCENPRYIFTKAGLGYLFMGPQSDGDDSDVTDELDEVPDIRRAITLARPARDTDEREAVARTSLAAS